MRVHMTVLGFVSGLIILCTVAILIDCDVNEGLVLLGGLQTI